MALAQERFSMHGDADLGADEANEHRAGRRGKKSGADEGQLARMVRELRELEDDITSKLAAADRLLGQLESRHTHEDGGYASAEEFEERMLASAHMLRALRDATSASTSPRPKLSVARREAKEPADARTRQNKALTSIARALERVRAFDAELQTCASAARTKLCTIESMRVYDECGYGSYEEFLERAMGPSPVLACAVSLAADEPPPPPAPEGPAAVASEAGADFPALFLEPSEGAADPASDVAATLEGPGDPQAPAAPEATPAPRRSRSTLIASVLLSVVATLGGAAAGAWSNGSAPDAPAEEAPSAVAAHPGTPPAPKASASAPTPRLASAPAQENPANAEGKRASH